MKHSYFSIVGAFCALIFGLSACDNGSENEYHYLSISTKSVAYADQESDTINVLSSDSWTAQCNADWLSLEYDNYKVPNTSSGASKLVPIIMTPNLTNEVRGTYLSVKAHNKTLNKSKVQVYWMNITYPKATYSGGSHNIDNWSMSDDLSALKATFSMTDSVHVQQDSVTFYLYDKEARLQTDADWIVLDKNVFTRPEKDIVRLQTARFSLKRNTTGADRTAVLKLRSSNGVETPIAVKQLH